MKKSRVIIVVLSVLLGLFVCFTGYIFAANEGKSFILISKDYVDQVLLPKIEADNQKQDTALQKATTELSQLKQQYDALNKSYNELLKRVEQGTGSSTTVSSGYTRVKIPQGKAIYPEGNNDVCLEIIIDKGNAVVVSPYDSQGILDVSDGTFLKSGQSVALQHYILIPHANDGRCIKASDSDVWILVRGNYTIE